MAKRMFITVLLNIFLLCLISVAMEYNDMEQRMIRLTDTVSTALETAVDTSMASEELFSRSVNSGSDPRVMSQGIKRNSQKQTESGTLVYLKNDKKWLNTNAYFLAFYVQDRGYLPKTEYDFGMWYSNNLVSGKKDNVEAVYTRLFGTLGKDTTGRAPTSDFKNFYNKTKNSIITKQPILSKVGGKFKVVDETFPTLTQMGLRLDDTYNLTDKFSSAVFRQVQHVGKRYASKNGADSGFGYTYSHYYLTPYSLGVTYVPPRVVVPLFLNNLTNICRWTRATDAVKGTASFNKSMAMADGCIPASIVTEVDENDEHAHVLDDSKIVNDGQIEYDTESIQVKVLYSTCNFYDEDNALVATRVLGSKSGAGATDTDSVLRNTVTKLRESDTYIKYHGIDTTDSDEIERLGTRVVAKIIVQLKVYIPYKQRLMQYICKLESKDGSHLGIRTVKNPNYNHWVLANDGVWFEYSTYRAISR